MSVMYVDISYLEAFSTFKRTCIPLAGGAFRETGTGTLSSGTGFLGTAGGFFCKKSSF